MDLHSQLHSLRKGDSPNDDYLLGANILIDNPTSIRETLSKKYVVMSVIYGLGFDWNDFITLVNLRLEPISLDELHR